MTAVHEAGALFAASQPKSRDVAVDERAWRRFALTFIIAVFGGLGIIYVALVAIDPYDTGRFPTFMGTGVSDHEMRTAVASRGRDPQFDAAIFGNMRSEQLDPLRISAATGLSFVSLMTPGAGAREQMTVMRYFMRHHHRIAAMVLNVDERWCAHDPAMPVRYAFPFWLYRGDLEYLANILQTRAIMHARFRIMMALGLAPMTDPAGYHDHEF